MIEDHINVVGRTNRLAIVIPAYKSRYLSETLDSIAAQTDQRFCVYIGDDCSPENIGDIVERYKGKFNYVYKRFDTNLGGKDLVAQWERCIAMTKGEEWIWLFSDDDIMDKGCVSGFYEQIVNKDIQCDLFRYDVQILKKGKLIESTDFPIETDSVFLLKNVLAGKCHCYAVEYIFSRDIYMRMNGFQNFDLAWNSDIATWIKFGINKIHTIKGYLVLWRDSGENITTINDMNMLYRKWNATTAFYIWLRDFFRVNSLHNLFFIDEFYIRTIYGTSKILPLKYCLKESKEYIGHGIRKWIMLSITIGYTIIHRTYDMLKSKILNLEMSKDNNAI